MLRALTIAAILLISHPAIAQNADAKRATKELKRCAPKTYTAAIECLDRFLPQASQAALAAPDGAIEAHFDLGMWIRNNWGLWRQGPLYRDLQAFGLSHPDDMSGLILDAFGAHERGEPFDAPKHIEKNRRDAEALMAQAEAEGRTGSFHCPLSGREPHTKKEIKAAFDACFEAMTAEPKGEQD